MSKCNKLLPYRSYGSASRYSCKDGGDTGMCQGLTSKCTLEDCIDIDEDDEE